jgi:hypothetical protein
VAAEPAVVPAELAGQGQPQVAEAVAVREAAMLEQLQVMPHQRPEPREQPLAAVPQLAVEAVADAVVVEAVVVAAERQQTLLVKRRKVLWRRHCRQPRRSDTYGALKALDTHSAMHCVCRSPMAASASSSPPIGA